LSPQPPAGLSPTVTSPPAASANGAGPAATAGALDGYSDSGRPVVTPGGLHRARLWCREANKALDVHYNPTQVTLKKRTAEVTHAKQAAEKGASSEYINTQTRDLTFTLTLEAWSTRRDVVEDVNTLQSWLNPTADSMRQGQTPRPPIVEFEWWSDPAPFKGRIKQADATYTVFGLDGKPVRATVTVAMTELPDPVLRTNPTSGSPGGGQTVLVRDGDSLASIAYHQYGDPSLWRAVAVANGIADPTTLAAGQRLAIPAPAHAREMTR
jgi:nucleoid-associated protein YgaU